MKIKNLLLSFGGMAAGIALSVSASAAGSNIGMLIGAEDINSLNSQEKAAATWFLTTYSDGVLITPNSLSKIDTNTLDAVWVNFDRLGITGTASIPAEFTGASEALKTFVQNGGSLYLTKHATLMLPSIDRTGADMAPNIISAGDGGNGTDVWNVNAYIGSWQINADNAEPDFTQIYDRTSHPMYAGMTSFAAYSEWNNCPHPAFPLEGTGTGAEMWREDHNCLWDLNALPLTAEGKNTVEKFEAQNNCTVVGTWGHVQDYAVAGVVEFNPTESYKGKVIANGLAAYEWAPRNGVNAYQANIEKMTENTLNYLAPARQNTGVEAVATVEEGKAEYYTIQGVRVENPSTGLFIKVANGKATKVMIKK